MSSDGQKIVQFSLYCPKCKYWSRISTNEPCDECLSNPINTWSHKPVKFEESKKKNRRKNAKNSRKKQAL